MSIGQTNTEEKQLKTWDLIMETAQKLKVYS